MLLPFEFTTPIETDRLRLRCYREADVDAVLAIHSQLEVVRYLYSDVLSRDEAAELIAQRIGQHRLAVDQDELALAVERTDDARLIGEMTLWVRSVMHEQGEFGFVFHPDVQGQGYAREAATAVLDLAFDTVGLHRVEGRTDSRNDASAGLMRRLDMRQEAHLRENEWFKGAWGDELVFAILAREWSARKSGAFVT